MSPTRPPEIPFISTVFHPSDFSEASENAFCHALAFALVRQTRLTLFHVGGEKLAEDLWGGFPSVRKTLAQWGLLDEDSPRSAIYERLNIRVEKISAFGSDPLKTILRHLEEKPTDLIVLATEQRQGLPRWLKRSVSEGVARQAKTMTLFVPQGGRGALSKNDGTLRVRNVLVPVDRDPSPQAAIVIATRLAQAVGVDTRIHLLSVGQGAEPRMELPEDEAWTWNKIQRQGDIVDEIVAASEETEADVVIMVTRGREGFLDALRGSTTEQVLRRARCPLLAVPTEWLAELARWQ